MSADAELEEALYQHVHALTVDIGPRAPFLGDGLARAACYIERALEEAGLGLERQRYQFHGLEVRNLIAAPEKAPACGDHLLVAAHYDSVPQSPGADDNASAVAVLLELARRFAATSAPIRFCAFTLEEPPAFHTRLQGSRVFVERLGPGLRRIKAALVLEMVGYTAPVQRYPAALRWLGYPERGDFLGLIGDFRSRALVRTLHGLLQAFGEPPVERLVVPCRGWLLPDVRLSDHAVFWDRGIPAVMLTDTAFYRNPHYHRPTDTIDTLDFPFMARLVRGLSFALLGLIRWQGLACGSSQACGRPGTGADA